MLHTQNRLRARRDFASVYSKGKAYHTPLLRVNVLSHPEMATRFGVVISNSVAKSAVVRNRKKRQVRAILQTLLPRVQPGHDVIIAFKVPGSTASYAALASDLALLLQKSHVL